MNLTKRTFLQGLLGAPALATPALLLTSAQQSAAQEMPAGQMPGYYRTRIGDIEVTALLDGYTEVPTEYIIGYEEEAAKAATAQSYHRFAKGPLTIPVNAYVVKTAEATILIGAGGVPAFFPAAGKLLATMASAGIAPADITDILLTHTHPDHIGTLATADGTKTFKNATLTCSQAEWDFIHDDAVRNAAPEGFRPMIDVARTALAPYAQDKRMFSGETELFAGLATLPLPGHTPGQTGYILQSNDERLLFWGDIIHFSTLQFANPDWSVAFDADPAMAAQTRRAILERASNERMAIAGAHVDFPGIGYVEKSGDAYRYVSAPWMPA